MPRPSLSADEKALRARIIRWIVAHFEHSPTKKANVFAEKMGVTQSLVSESRTAVDTKNYDGKPSIGLTTLARLSENLEANLNWVLGHEPDEDPKFIEEIETRLERIWREGPRRSHKRTADAHAPERRRQRAAGGD